MAVSLSPTLTLQQLVRRPITSTRARSDFATRLLYSRMETTRKPPEYALEIFADAASVKDMVKGS